jgi:hypothetical protein
VDPVPFSADTDRASDGAKLCPKNLKIGGSADRRRPNQTREFGIALHIRTTNSLLLLPTQTRPWLNREIVQNTNKSRN